MSRARFHLYGEVTSKNPHLQPKVTVEITRVTPQELAELTAGQQVYVETGVCEGRRWHDEGISDEARDQFFQELPRSSSHGSVLVDSTGAW